jgi:L-2-hydroxyglutarate oxidase LhgO
LIKTDFLIIGGGIIGLSIARELQQRHPSASIALLEKETQTGTHASGRNSGVLHSGIYYSSDSLKARFTRDGNYAWQNYCEERNLPLDRCGKLVLAPNESDHIGLDTLEERGRHNGVEVQRLDEYETHEIEPRANTLGYALFVPSTSTVDPARINIAMTNDFIEGGGKLHLDTPYLHNLGQNSIRAGSKIFSAGHIINCAGLYADRVAQDFDFGHAYTMLPFKGIYLYASSGMAELRTHIYPVPNLDNPFLGVHFTRTVDGKTKIGPTAIPALWREQYQGLRNFRVDELAEIGIREWQLFTTNHNNFRKLAWQELQKQRKSRLIADAALLLDGTKSMGFRHWGKPGIRAQLIERKSNNLVMDFVIEGDAHSTHVLNAVSPAFTCALPFASHVVDKIKL